MSGDHNMHQKPKALELADALTECVHAGVGGPDLEAAAELRRLQADNEAKDALLRQALEALEKYRRRMLVEAGCRCDNGDNIIAAINEHLK